MKVKAGCRSNDGRRVRYLEREEIESHCDGLCNGTENWRARQMVEGRCDVEGVSGEGECIAVGAQWRVNWTWCALARQLASS